MIRLTLKELKQKIEMLPDDTIICCQSDSEGNETATCLGIFIEKVGKKTTYEGYNFTEGDNIIGVDMEQDKGKYVLIFQPSL